MVAPVEIKDKRASAVLGVESVFGVSTVTSAFAVNPMKLLAPRSRGKSVWAYTSSFGGGLVAGDQTGLDITLGADTRCFASTQASTKIYRNPSNRPCGHVTHAIVKENALLVLAPDPVQSFAGSSYRQRQEFHLSESANLVLLDWFSSGRVARGERWQFSGYESRTDVFVSDKRVFVDALTLASPSVNSTHVTGRFNCFATLLFLGDLVREHSQALITAIAARPVEPGASLICSASPVRNGALLRVAGEGVEQVGREMYHHLKPLADLLGDDPWARKW